MKKIKPRFDMSRKPKKPKLYLKLAMYIAAPFYMWFNKGHVKTEKAVRKIKGPFLTLASHASFMDFAMMSRGIAPRTCGWVVAVDEFRRGDWLMYGIGGMPKRKFTHDIITAKHILYYLKQLKHPCTIYPEARWSLAGVNERLDSALGKLCKAAKVPVVLFKANGNFVNSPQWSKHPYRRIRQEGNISLLLSAEQVAQMTADEIQGTIEKAFVRDEYQWQYDNKHHTKCKKRADGLYRILYKCPHCGTEFKMNSEGIHLWCEEFGSNWEMDTLSRLHGINTDNGFEHIPDWYNWEREEVRKEVQNGTYSFSDAVRVEDYYSTKVGFIPVGSAKVTHDKNGFTFEGEVDGKPFNLNKPVSSMYSVHIEYNFLKRGDAFDIATDKTTYMMYPLNSRNCLTKLHFAAEELYDFYKK